jgi:hypothetical protein
MERIASGKERPCVQMTAPVLIRHAQANWDDVFCLYQIVAEARIRVWKNPKSKAKKVFEQAPELCSRHIGRAIQVQEPA